MLWATSLRRLGNMSLCAYCDLPERLEPFSLEVCCILMGNIAVDLFFFFASCVFHFGRRTLRAMIPLSFLGCFGRQSMYGPRPARHTIALSVDLHTNSFDFIGQKSVT